MNCFQDFQPYIPWGEPFSEKGKIMKYVQTSFIADNADFVNPKSVSGVKCWRCQNYFPASKIIHFTIRDYHGYIQDYQACEPCRDLMICSHEWGW